MIKNKFAKISMIVVVAIVLLFFGTGLGRYTGQLIREYIVSVIETIEEPLYWPIKHCNTFTLDTKAASTKPARKLALDEAPDVVGCMGYGYVNENTLCGDLSHIQGVPLKTCLDRTESVHICGPADTYRSHKTRCIIDYELYSKLPITDIAMVYINQLKSLTKLDISNNQISDRGISAINSLQLLTSLNVSNTLVTDKGMSTIGNLKSLTDLNLAHTRVGDTGISQIRELKSLERLKMESTNITGTSLQYLKDLPLEELTIELKPGELKYLASLSKLNKLRYLNLKTEPLSDSDLEYLKGLPSLDTLYISGAKLNSSQRKYLEKLGKFKNLFA